MGKKMITQNIAALVNYGVASGLLDEADKIYTTNRLLELFGIEEYDDVEVTQQINNPADFDLESLLKEMLDYAAEKGLMPDDSIVYRDLFDTKIMGCLVPRPSDVIFTFNKLYNEKGAKAATEWYYAFSQNTDYIRRYRIAKDMKWKADTEYGQMDITINLSKPEKDPKAIAAAKNAKQSGYPKCQLCIENEGYAGRVNHPARQNHRIIPVEIQGNKWGFQYSPYVYYNEHCIVFNSQHIPMKIEHNTFVKLFNFVEQFPHYFVGSKADLPIVGGSILSHDHFQGDNYELDLVLRNNITTSEHPLGVYHPHAELHHIKKENIGLIEVMGLAVLPSRLKSEIELLAKAIVENKDIRADEMLEKHADWVDEVMPKYTEVNNDNIMDILQKEVGIVFGKVLEHAGVYKRDEKGKAGFERFIKTLDN